MSFRIIDNKKIDLTDDEWNMYEKLVKSYTKEPYQKGEDFFVDLFETDDNGIMLFLKPPSHRQTSLEIYLFLVAVFQHQHLRLMYKELDAATSKINLKLKEIDEVLAQLKAEKSS